MSAKPQHRIARSLAEPESVRVVREMVEAAPGLSRRALAEKVCERFGFRDARGVWQTATCTTALRRMERQGQFMLAAPGRQGGWKRRPRGTGIAPALPAGVPAQAGEIQDLKLVLVGSTAERRLWNELLLREHPQGEQIITGRQLRYLIQSAHGLLGALGVSASALHLEARDRWIGWDWDLRSQYLERVICLSRFLIRSGLQCRNLASRVLGMFCQRVAADMEQAYGCRPWLLESFVDTASHTGTCYRAANWLRVGHTKGRGRYDREKAVAGSPKDIYIYCLDPAFRTHLGLPHDAGAVALKPGDGLAGEQWTEREFGGAPLGDHRLARRLVSIAAVKAANPQEPFLECARGRSADMQGYYRFIEHPDEDALTMDAILRPHVERTIKRVRAETRVLCPQDSSDLDYSNLVDCSGLGQTGTNSRGAQAHGLRLHTTLALTTAALPLGILSGECQARQFRPGESRERRRHLPIEEKETYRWLKSVQVCERVAEQVPGTRLVCMMDREGDIFEVFHHWQKSRRVELLVRAAKDRRSDSPDAALLFDQVRSTPERCRIHITIPKRRDRSLRTLPAEVELTVRYAPVHLLVPKHCRLPDAKPISVWMVHACEENPPENTPPHRVVPDQYRTGRKQREGMPVSARILLPLAHRGMAQGAQERLCR